MKITIETIITLFEKELTHEALIGSKHDRKWSREFLALFLFSIAAPIIYITCITALSSENSRWFSPILLSCISVVALSILLIIFIGENINYRILDIIIREYNKKYCLNITNSWNQETISKIQYLTLEEWFKSNNIELTRAKMDTIIEAIKIKVSMPAYSYNLTTSATKIICSAIITTVIGKLLGLGSTYQDTLFVLITICTVALAVLLFIFGIEMTLIRWQASKNKIKYHRLLNILINYSLNCLNK